MGILEGMMGRREPVLEYRTVDGGHPAPYPDMTDEQLYNYEITFNVPHRTFTQPPHPGQRQALSAPPPAPPPASPGGNFSQAPNVSQAIDVEPRVTSAPTHAPTPRQDGERLRRNKAFDAPRYTARKGVTTAASVERAPGSPAPLDFSKSVRMITTKQAVDIITTRARHPIYKVHGYIGDDDVVTVFTLEGQLSENGPRFLENAPAIRPLHLNIYANASAPGGERYRITQHETRAQADANAEPGRIACVEVQFNA